MSPHGDFYDNISELDKILDDANEYSEHDESTAGVDFGRDLLKWLDKKDTEAHTARLNDEARRLWNGDDAMNDEDKRATMGGAVPAMVMTQDEKLEEIFTYHAPTGAEQLAAYQAIREAALMFARVIVVNTPRCSDQSAAIRLLRESAMTANAAVALNGLNF
jgi:hypothetical protein